MLYFLLFDCFFKLFFLFLNLFYYNKNTSFFYSMYPIYCINLENRQDRKQHTFQEFEKIDISLNDVIYLPFTKDIRGGIYGCFQSHMTVWNDFFIHYPNQKYCLIFEDDFVVTSQTKVFINKVIPFLDKDIENEIDLLFLHNICIDVKHKQNNTFFSNGFGLTTHSYFIKRSYIKSIMNQYGTLPSPTGKHLDFELNFNKFSKNNWLYTEKIFYTNKECIKQLNENESTSDNYSNAIDSFFRQKIDLHSQLEFSKNIYLFLRNNQILNEIQLKQMSCFLHSILNKS